MRPAHKQVVNLARIALVDSLVQSKTVVYTDHSRPSDQVLSMLDKLADGNLEKLDCIKSLRQAYVDS